MKKTLEQQLKEAKKEFKSYLKHSKTRASTDVYYEIIIKLLEKQNEELKGKVKELESNYNELIGRLRSNAK